MADYSEEGQSMKTSSKDEHPKSGTKPRNVSSTIWERFQNVSKRTDEVTKRSTEKRIQQIQKSVLSTVENHFKSDEEKETLKKDNVEFSSPSTDKTIFKDTTDSHGKSSDDQFTELNKCMGLNDHLVRADSSRQYVKSGLEKQIDQAVASGDITRAESLSDQLATRDFGVKVSEAFQAKAYLKRKKEEEDTAKAKKKKNLAWGFQHKERWETKSNM